MSKSEVSVTSGPRWLRRIMFVMLALVLSASLLFSVSAAAMWPNLPDTSSLANYRPAQPLRVYTADGVEIGGFGQERREHLRIEQFPPMMVKSLLAVEDARFYDHPGIDIIGVLRAAFSNLTGGRTQGASTITQQVARTFFLTRERTFSRKFKEALLSLKIERELTKNQILELYMNQIYLGARTYGFAEAAKTYFGKPIGKLSIAEYAMLAGLPQNPAYANPIRNPQRAKARQLVVLARMHDEGVIDDIVYAAAKREKLAIRQSGEVDVHGEYVAEMARAQVYAQYGDSAYTSGMKVITTLRAADQQAAWHAVRKTLIEREMRTTWRGPEAREEIADQLNDQDPELPRLLNDHDEDEQLRLALVTKTNPKRVTVVTASGEVLQISGNGLRHAQAGLSPSAKAAQKISRGAVVRVYQQGKDWVITQWPRAEGALVALDPNDGEVRALVGGFDFHRNQFNHVTQAWRQPGSTYKPFLYSATLESGVMPETLINDAPLTDVGNWSPSNADGSAEGPIPLHRALARSKNLVSIRLVQLIGPEAARQWTARFGFDVSKQPDNLTLALGSGSTTVLQMASAYAVVANGGMQVSPLIIRRVLDAKGKVVFEAKPKAVDESNRVIPARNAFVTATLLNEVARSGTAARAQAILKRPDIYGKTGTTNDVFDAWFAGFQPNLVAVVWFGFDKPASLGSQASGSSLALPAWIQYMQTALRNEPVKMLGVPEGVIRTETGWRYSEWADGGFLTELGMDETPIDRSMIPVPPVPGQAASQAEPEDNLKSFIERLFGT